jgi:hypothetical protein
MALRPEGPDTQPSAERVQIGLLRQASIARRVARARSLSQTTIAPARRAIRRAHPDLSEREVALRFIALYYGEELATRVRQYLACHRP